MESNFTVNMNEYLPLRDVVFNTLRQAILRGELKPGERLMEVQLANKLGVSRTPIREAIRKLELEGLVTMIPNKGAYVTGISQKTCMTSTGSVLCWKVFVQDGRQSILQRSRSKDWKRSSFYPNFIWNAPANRPGRSQNLTESSTKSCTKPPIVVYWNMYYRIS